MLTCIPWPGNCKHLVWIKSKQIICQTSLKPCLCSTFSSEQHEHCEETCSCPCVLIIRRGFIMGVWNSHTSVGNILGSLIAGVFVSSAWGMSFIVPGIIIASTGILCFFFLVESQFLLVEETQTALFDWLTLLFNVFGAQPRACHVGVCHHVIHDMFLSLGQMILSEPSPCLKWANVGFGHRSCSDLTCLQQCMNVVMMSAWTFFTWYTRNRRKECDHISHLLRVGDTYLMCPPWNSV